MDVCMRLWDGVRRCTCEGIGKEQLPIKDQSYESIQRISINIFYLTMLLVFILPVCCTALLDTASVTHVHFLGVRFTCGTHVFL